MVLRALMQHHRAGTAFLSSPQMAGSLVQTVCNYHFSEPPSYHSINIICPDLALGFFVCSQLILDESSSCLTRETVVSISGCMVLWVSFLNWMSRCQHRTLFYSECKVWSLLAKVGSALSQLRMRLNIGCILQAISFSRQRKHRKGKRRQHLAVIDFVPPQ